MNREVLFDGKIFDVVRKEGLEIVEHGPSVAIVPVCDGHLTLVRQRRPGVGGTVVGSMLLELPAGGVEDGESPLAAARRELREEIEDGKTLVGLLFLLRSFDLGRLPPP